MGGVPYWQKDLERVAIDVSRYNRLWHVQMPGCSSIRLEQQPLCGTFIRQEPVLFWRREVIAFPFIHSLAIPHTAKAENVLEKCSNLGLPAFEAVVSTQGV